MLSFPTLSGKTYRLKQNLTTPDLSDPNWLDAGPPPLTGDGTNGFFLVPPPAGGVIFYTVEYTQ